MTRTTSVARRPAVNDPAPTQEQPPANVRVSILDTVASRFGMDPIGFQRTLRSTVFKDANNEEFAALLVVANEYKLNPLTKEIYAFKAQGGGIVPLVSIDGWVRIMNEHPQFDGIEFTDLPDDEGNLMAIEATIHRKDRSHPIKVIEYLSECKRNTDPWKNMPARMLRHKSLIQCARYAFGFSGIYSEDDVDLLANGGQVRDLQPVPPMRNVTPQIEDGREEEEHDPETGEVAQPKRQSAPKQEAPQAENPTLTIEAAKAEIDSAETVMDVNSRVGRLSPQLSEEDAEALRSHALEKIAQLKGGN